MGLADRAFIGAAGTLTVGILYFIMMWLRERYARARYERMISEFDLVERKAQVDLARLRRHAERRG